MLTKKSAKNLPKVKKTWLICTQRMAGEIYRMWQVDLLNYYFVAARHSQHFAGLLVKKFEVEIVI